MIIGITGGSGAGKSYIAAVFAENGFKIIDADAIAKDIMKNSRELKENIKKHFGDRFVLPDGLVDRRSLGQVVFADSEKRKLLNSLTHPEILAEISRQAKLYKNAVLDVPLLIGSGIESLCDVTVAVLAEKKYRIERIVKRDGITEETALNRINSQLSDEEYIKGTDLHIYNNGNEDEIRKQIIDIIKRYKESDCTC